MTTRCFLLAFIAGASLLAAPAAAQAQERWDPLSGFDADHARDRSQRGEQVPMKTVRERVLRNYPGAQFLDARTTFDRVGAPREIHVLIINRGRRVVVRLDARTGHFLGEAPDAAPPDRSRSGGR